MRGTTDMLRASNLSYHYGDELNAVSEFTEEFREGEVTYLCGPSGSGKTTLCLLLSDLLKPQSGSVTISPENSPYATMVLQFAEELFLTESVNEEIALLSSLVERRLAERLASSCGLKLDEICGHHPLTLSFGQSRLLAISLQCAQDTPVMVLDEPTLGLDEVNMNRVAEMISELSGAGKVVVVVTHDVELIERQPGKVIVMSEGRLLWSGASTEFLLSHELMTHAAFA